MLKTILIFTLIAFSFTQSWAGEEKAAKSEKAEGGGKGDGKGEDEKGKKVEIPEWQQITNQIQHLEGRRTQKLESIKKLIEEKEKLPENSPQIKENIDQMVLEYKELNKITKDYDKQITILKFRFPERGLKGTRKYETLEVKPLEQLERELGTEGRLTRNMKKIKSQYADPDEKPAEDKAHVKEVEKKGPDEKPVDEAGSILIQK